MYQGISSSVSVIALLTDFGLHDPYVGVMKGVMAGIAPGTTLVDLTHAVPVHDVAAGAWILKTSYRYFPAGTVFVCVVDPGVGSERAPLALRAGVWTFVGPDNGLFQAVLHEQIVHEVVTLTNPAYQLSNVSATFQGRDIFAPVAAHLARGLALQELGVPRLPATLHTLALPDPQLKKDRIEAQIVYIDHFGNLVTNIPLHLVPDFFTQPEIRLMIPAHQIMIRERRRFFSEGQNGQETTSFLYGDSSGYLGIAICNQSAAQQLQVGYGDAVTLLWGKA